MDKLRIFNIFAIAFLVSLLVQYWFFPKNDSTPVISDIYLTIETNDIVVPNIPKITLHNSTKESITIQPCNDINITIDSLPLSGIQDIAKNFCTPLTIS